MTTTCPHCGNPALVHLKADGVTMAVHYVSRTSNDVCRPRAGERRGEGTGRPQAGSR
jgi:hypothetical protein